MTVFQQVLWMLANIRVLGKQPGLPAQGDDLIRYAVVLELQYSRICTQLGIARRRQMAAIAWAHRASRTDCSCRTPAAPAAGLARASSKETCGAASTGWSRRRIGWPEPLVLSLAAPR